ncbi:unnamed protein product [Mycena citricolor]|uniref:Uncharacterized protein n=1 Tax=Mycena citricolor TaxID=2018698 RepID=A0AAD2H7E9_9AGAR|nr:unnamed protein product [Mycena citricolor]
MMDSECHRDLSTLAILLDNLPHQLPEALPSAPANKLLDFALDLEWVDDVGEEAAANRELEISLGPRNHQGIFAIESRGPGIQCLSSVLVSWIQRYPKNVIFRKWLQDAIASAQDVFSRFGVEIPGEAPKVVGSPATAVDGKLGLTSVRQTTLSFGKILSNTQGTKKDKKRKILDHDQLKASSAATKHRPDSKIVTKPVLLKVSKPFWVDESSKKKGVRCAASASCGTIWASWPRNKQRVLKHASACGSLATYNGGELVTKALHIHAQSNPKLLEQLRTTMGIEPRSTTSSSQTEARNNLVEPQEPPPLKRQRTVVMTAAPAQPSSTPSAINIDSEVLPESEEKRRYQTEGRKDLARKANDAVTVVSLLLLT